MREGWAGQDYPIVFAGDEVPSATERYAIGKDLSGYSVIGLCGWDDFLVEDVGRRLFRVPTVPCIAKHLESVPNEILSAPLQEDQRFLGKIKWYVKPIAFGGSPTDESNVVWIGHDEHSAIVRWWNEKYREVAAANR